jgi:hypothetical protein
LYRTDAFATSNNELCWPKVQGLFNQVITSFTLHN